MVVPVSFIAGAIIIMIVIKRAKPRILLVHNYVNWVIAATVVVAVDLNWLYVCVCVPAKW